MELYQTYVNAGVVDPEKAYMALRGENTYLLESIEGSLKKARYSFIGFNPVAKLTYNKKADFKVYNREFKAKPHGDDPFTLLQSLIEQYHLKGPTLSRFCGGFVGYMGYDVVRHYTPLDGARDDLGQPDCEFVLTKNNIIFDHKTKETYFVENHFLDGHEVDVESSIRRLEDIIRAIEEYEPEKSDEAKTGKPKSNTSRKGFEDAVVKAKEYIRDGDVFQVVLSQRLTQKYSGDKFQVYKNLLNINPSPYMYFLDFGERVIVGSSPETLTRVEKRMVSTYPIAGTRPRGKTRKEDKSMEVELLSDEKERAEHLMLVDLGRNDVGRVSEYGSVKVPKYYEIEKYSHVMHISSEVTGRLKPEKTEFDALKSIFPAGTVSGAPKVRAMQIIDELEPARRGVYAGCIGYFSFSRSMDTAIAIRTIVFEGDTAYVQAGAGIVADSIPHKEYEETMNKAKALLNALEVGK